MLTPKILRQLLNQSVQMVSVDGLMKEKIATEEKIAKHLQKAHLKLVPEVRCLFWHEQTRQEQVQTKMLLNGTRQLIQLILTIWMTIDNMNTAKAILKRKTKLEDMKRELQVTAMGFELTTTQFEN